VCVWLYFKLKKLPSLCWDQHFTLVIEAFSLYETVT